MRRYITQAECTVFRILAQSLRPVTLPLSGDAGITTLICHHDIDQFIISFHAFLYSLNRLLPCTVFEDGSLTERDIARLEKKIRNVTIIPKYRADTDICRILADYPSCLAFRRTLNYPYNQKLFDPVLLTKYTKIIYFDPDVLLLHRPDRVIRWLADRHEYSLYARHRAYEDFFRPHVEPYSTLLIRMFHERWNGKSDYYFNSGFLCLTRRLYKLSRLEVLIYYIRKTGLDKTWVPEQCLWATLFAESPAECLDNSYIHLDSPVEIKYLQNLTNRTMVHFNYFAKPYYLPNVIRLLFRTAWFGRQCNDDTLGIGQIRTT